MSAQIENDLDMAESSLFCRKLMDGEIKLAEANRLVASKSTASETHVHADRLHITFTEKGRGFSKVGDLIYKLEPGVMHFVYPNEVHQYYSDSKDPYTIYFLHFDWVGKTPDIPRSLLVKKENIKKICEIFYRLFHFHHYFKGASKNARLLSLLFELFAEISENSELADARNLGVTAFDKDFFMDVLTKLQTPPFSFPGIDELAKQKNMSRRSFTRAFRKNTGASVMEYYNSARNTYARFLLKTSDLSIKEIAFLCGYSNSQNMRRALARDNG